MKRVLCCALLSVVLFCGTALSQGVPQFAADFISREARETTTGRIYLGIDKFRLDLRSAGREGAMIIDLRSRKTTVLVPQQKMYLEVPFDATAQDIPAILPANRGNPCVGWTGCRKRARETMNGRVCDRWELSDVRGMRTVWIDLRLGVYVKTLLPDGSVAELRNIQEGPQPSSHFEVPAGYKKLDPRTNSRP
jgi:hypothetical protein